MDKIIYLLIILFFIGFMILFINFFYKPKKNVTYHDFITDRMRMNENYEQTEFITDIADGRKSIMLDGFGHGITVSWNMNIPNTMGEQMWHSSFSKDKPIIRIGESPHIYYNPKYNVLRVIVKYKESPFYSHYPIIELKNVPLQRWNNYIVVLHNNDIKIYLNKKLIVHKSLPNIPEVTSSNIIVGEQNNNIIGEISQLRVYFRPYDAKDIKKIM